MTKAALRLQARRRLRSMTEEERAVLGARAAAEVWRIPQIADARTILLYASLAEEVPTDGIAGEARARGIEVVYPRRLDEEVGMSLHVVRSSADLHPGGSSRIREPAKHCPAADIEGIDVALIPGLAWDRAGHRLGRGAGYYDRLLASPAWRALRCGLFFALQEVPVIATDPWDSPLDMIVTEHGSVILNFEF